MGNPLSPVLADIVMTKLMKSCLNKFQNKPTLIKKYVDDIILIASPKQIDDLFNEFQKFNNNMKFTKEDERDQKIAFLDLKLIRMDNKIITDWYSKPTNSNRLLNYLSSHPQRVKINIAKSLINKIFKLSDRLFHKKNEQIIYHILIKNNYPKHLVKSLIHKYKFPDSNHHHTISIANSSNSQHIGTFYKPITFNQNISGRIIKIIKKNNKNIKVAEKVHNKMQNIYSKLKDNINKEQQENIIYSIPCIDCNKVYIGQSKRHFEKRMKEHLYDVKNVHVNNNKTALVHHHFTEGHNFNISDAKIIDRETQYYRRLTLEACYIWKNSQNAVNFRTDTKNISSSYKSIIDTINHNNHQS